MSEVRPLPALLKVVREAIAMTNRVGFDDFRAVYTEFEVRAWSNSKGCNCVVELRGLEWDDVSKALAFEGVTKSLQSLLPGEFVKFDRNCVNTLYASWQPVRRAA